MVTYIPFNERLCALFRSLSGRPEHSSHTCCFIPTYQNRGLLHTLLYRSFSICCDFKTFHFEIDHLKTILMKNNYPPNFIDSCIKSFLNKLYTPKVIVQNVPKRNVFVKLSFLGSTLLQI